MGEWKSKALTELADFVNGYAFNPTDWGKEGLPIIRIEQLKKPDTICDYYSGNLPEYNIINNGDLIFSWSASLFLKIWNDGKAALNQHLFKVVNKNNVDKFFLKYLIEFNLPKLIKSAHGSTMQHITRKELALYCDIPLSKVEQIQLGKILTHIDQAIQQTEAVIAKHQRIKTGLMQDLLTKGIDENGNIRSEATHEFKDSPLGKIPKEWHIKNIEELAQHIGSGITPTGGSQVYSSEGVPFIRSQNVYDDGLKLEDIAFIDEKIDSSMKRSQVFNGDILLNITGASIGRCCFVPEGFPRANVNQHVCIIRLKEIGNLDPYFFSTLLSSSIGQKQIKNLNAGGNREGLNYQQIKCMLFPFPSKEERKLVSTILMRQNIFLEKEIRLLTKLKLIKTGLMQDLLTGKVSVEPLLNSQTKLKDIKLCHE